MRVTPFPLVTQKTDRANARPAVPSRSPFAVRRVGSAEQSLLRRGPTPSQS